MRHNDMISPPKCETDTSRGTKYKYSVDVIIIIMGMKCHITPNATGKPPTHLLNVSPN
jgi:hypothetical protein